MVPRLAVPVLACISLAVAAFSLPLRVVPLCLTLLGLGLAPFGRFFGFDFLAELFVFGVFGLAAFAFVVGFLVFVGFSRFVVAFFIVRFGFVVGGKGDERAGGGDLQRLRVRRGGCGEQQQRGEQEDQQVREFPHGPFIGAHGGLR